MPEQWGPKRARVDASIGGLGSRFRLSREHKENPVTLGVDGMCYSSRSYPEGYLMGSNLNKLRVLGTILSSSLFFFVSCSSGMYAGYQVLPELDARDIAAGDEPHRMIFVLARTPTDTHAVRLDFLDDYLAGQDSTTFLLPVREGESDAYTDRRPDGGLQYRYSASGIVNGEQTVSLDVADYDESRGSYRYIATRTGVTPTYSSYVRYMELFANALPYALILAIVLRIIGKLLLRRTRESSSPGAAASGPDRMLAVDAIKH